MRRMLLLLFLASSVVADEASDLRAARAVFEENIAAIHAKDRARYLAVYLQDETLVRTGPTGFATGYEEFAKGAGAEWPSTLEATDLRLTPIRPGIVYGTYRYRVRYEANEILGVSERLFVETPKGWRVALTGAIATPGVPPSPRAITNATLIDGRGGAPVRSATIVMRDGRIECAGAECQAPAGVDIVDARGLFVTPGLVDAHVHFGQTGWADGRPDSLDLRATYPYEKTVATLNAHPETFARSYLCSGVTSVFDVGGYPWTLRLADRFASDPAAPHITAAGPLVSTDDQPLINLAGERQLLVSKDAATARSSVAYLAAQGAKAIKFWYLSDAADAINAAGAAATEAKLPLIVHATDLAKAKAALRAGAKLLVHSVDDAAIDDEFLALAKEHGTIVTPTLTVFGGYARMYRSVFDRKAPAIDDPNHCVDAATKSKVASTATLPAALAPEALVTRMNAFVGSVTATATANLKKLVDAGIPIATGTDAGNPLTLHGPAIYAEMEAMQNAGMTPMQVIVASTSTAARASMLDSVTGTIEKGKDADLLLLTADPTKDVSAFRKLKFVVRGGVVRGIEELSAMAK
ncbi:MAG TPA: amidohydrolase family protein [Thermoanaerobaculia bacterium]|nr:amidohydrolase family protein [Thermoanaerobaculia bacterium]